MPDPLRQLLNQHIITPLSYYFAQFVAQKSLQPINSLLCLTAALLSQRNQQGDICINLNDFANSTPFASNEHSNQDELYFPDINTWLKALKQHECVSTDFKPQILLLDGHSLYLGKLWHFENFVVTQIKQRIDSKPSVDIKCLQKGLNTLFTANLESSDGESVDWQKIAASIAVTQKFSVISGGPGTGKTTTLIKVLALLIEQNEVLNIQLCAPTGKAAIRMLEAINSRKDDLNLEPKVLAQLPDEAKTIHRLLGYQQGIFKANAQHPLNVDCLVVDEASMIDLELMHHLMSALPAKCNFILLGDKDQLSSVDAGHVFSDICGRGQAIYYTTHYADLITQINTVDEQVIASSDHAPTIANSIALLKTSYRFSDDSAIGRLAKQVNAGAGEAALKLFSQHKKELNFIAIEDEQLAKQSIDLALKHYEKVVEAKNVEEAVSAFAVFQCLCAVHQGPFGVKAFNDTVTQRLQLRHKINSSSHYNGRPILMTQNDYEQNLFNGDIGILWQKDNTFFAYFQQVDGTLKSYPLVSLSHFDTAWAITVHKSQGSEYNEVLLILPSQDAGQRLRRELIYTGITRAKLVFNLCAKPHVFISSCQQKTQRTSNLSKKLGWD